MDTAAGHTNDGLPVGARALDIEGVDPSGSLSAWRPGHGRSALLLFGSPGCAPCHEIMPYLDRLAEEQAQEGFAVLAIVAGERQAAEQMATLAPAVRCVADGRGIAASDYEVVVNPFAFAIDVDGRVQARA
ncbi:MAG: TlpA family protein disulfide reductase [Nocardioidaceae bacterium]